MCGRASVTKGNQEEGHQSSCKDMRPVTMITNLSVDDRWTVFWGGSLFIVYIYAFFSCLFVIFQHLSCEVFIQLIAHSKLSIATEEHLEQGFTVIFALGWQYTCSMTWTRCTFSITVDKHWYNGPWRATVFVLSDATLQLTGFTPPPLISANTVPVSFPSSVISPPLEKTASKPIIFQWLLTLHPSLPPVSLGFQISHCNQQQDYQNSVDCEH